MRLHPLLTGVSGTMKVSGFSFIRNAVHYDYPVVEAITSILPLCDEFVIAVGNSNDATYDLINSIDSKKIRIIDSTWNDSLREGGQVLAEETNKAFDAVSKDSDWAFYIQGDEVVHEKYLPTIQQALEDNLLDRRVEGLLFNYKHFYGSYDFVADSRSWYRREIRIIRNNKAIRSYKDAQGFRKQGQKLKVKLIDAWVYHYGWVKHPRAQQLKQQTFNKYWHDDETVIDMVGTVDEFDYSGIDSVKKFEETHPAVMKPRVEKMNWQFSFNPANRKLPLKKRFSDFIEKKTGYRIGEYKNYHLIP